MKRTVLLAAALILTASFPSKSHAIPKGIFVGGAGSVAVGLVALFGGDSGSAKGPATTEFAYLNSLPLGKSLMNQAASGAQNTQQILNQ